MNVMALKLSGLLEELLKLEKETRCFISLKVSGLHTDVYSVSENFEINFDIKSCISLPMLNDIIGRRTKNMLARNLLKKSRMYCKGILQIKKKTSPFTVIKRFLLNPTS